jgi:hypothetical protein
MLIDLEKLHFEGAILKGRTPADPDRMTKEGKVAVEEAKVHLQDYCKRKAMPNLQQNKLLQEAAKKRAESLSESGAMNALTAMR